jgi:acetyl esterase/lipase
MTSPAIDKQTYIYKVAEGAAIPVDIYTPAGSALHPAILWIHGGALIAGMRSRLAEYQLARYVQAGYAVAAIDYRLAPETKLEGIIDDLRDAYSWTLREGPRLFRLDPGRVAIVGHSAGGYLALMAGCCVTPRPKAVVSFYGYGDIIGDWYSRPDPFYLQEPLISAEDAYAVVGKTVLTEATSAERWQFYLYCRQNGRWPIEVAGHDPNQEPDWFTPYCPLRNITSDYPPTFLIHGDQDTDVPYEQSVLMANELARRQVEHTFVAMPNYGHAFDYAEDAPDDMRVQHLFDEVVKFLSRHV